MIDVRGMILEKLTYRDLMAWAAYYRARRSERQAGAYLRDPDAIESQAAALYGG